MFNLALHPFHAYHNVDSSRPIGISIYDKIEYDDPGMVQKSSAESSTRPQQSAAVSHHDQMSQARLSTAGYQGRVSSHLVSRAPSVSESGVSMLGTDDEGGYSADEEEAAAGLLPRFIATATSAKLYDGMIRVACHKSAH